MKRIICEIEGDSPLLMNSPHNMLAKKPLVAKPTAQRNQKEEAENVAYRTTKGDLYVPAAALKGCLINAAAYKKFGKFAARPIISGAVRIEPIEILLNQKDYEIDVRTVVIQKNRVPKARPRFDTWKLKFTIVFNPELIPDPNAIHEILKEAGQRVGILDFSPRNRGEFGCFRINKFLPKK